MRVGNVPICLAYILAGCSVGTSSTTLLRRQCPTAELLLSSIQSCIGDAEGSEIFEQVEGCIQQQRQVEPSQSETQDVWISQQTGLAYNGTTPACTSHFEHLNDILCVYAYPEFHNNRGIAIFTTPTLANEFRQRVGIISAQLSTTPQAHLNALSTDYAVSALEGRGFGALATTDLSTGTLLTTTTPILVVHNAPSTPSFDRESYLRLAISLLPPTTQSHFLSLARIYHDPRVTHQDIVKANAFALDIGGTSHLALFPEPSRFNHDCAPNAMYRVDSLSLLHEVHIVSGGKVDVGQELTISYLDPFLSVRERHDYLLEAFGFECRCRRCLEGEEDDAAMAEIKRLEGLLGDWSAASAVQWFEYTDMAERVIELYERRGLQGFMNTAYGHAALAYNAVGESGRATMYARKALDVARWRHGQRGSRAVEVWEEFLDMGAWKHWSWRRRMPE
ncbi:uncharacterized protein HMPREF1541_09695 [Cyphellophora europaea CBS 101466]|uniref:SET domain-containing protein n=1 Tax=Cyphellophora europaea (strain CBS 101466) TaxID=1220924 RepID=W2S860_CYPE1|nr:uncharacterized protein HMPREF1541_09695 [Cyphellophora europaea CBS 101466]ETN44820.1 hypothetical protein HMPREF1541_09695 [Cyphellophora europaea CBS 101466]